MSPLTLAAAALVGVALTPAVVHAAPLELRITPAWVQAAGPVGPGVHRLPAITVRNVQGPVVRVRVTVSGKAGGAYLRVRRTAFVLGPGEAWRVRWRLFVPRGTAPGHYTLRVAFMASRGGLGSGGTTTLRWEVV